MGVEIVDDTGKILTIVQQDDAPAVEGECIWHDFDRDVTARYRAILMNVYPGYDWRVEVRHAQGIAYVSLPLFSVWGEVVHLSELMGDVRHKALTDAAGALLERYRLPRGKADMAAIDAAVAKYMPSLTYRLRPPD
jgi:hypothetical protein